MNVFCVLSDNIISEIVLKIYEILIDKNLINTTTKKHKIYYNYKDKRPDQENNENKEETNEDNEDNESTCSSSSSSSIYSVDSNNRKKMHVEYILNGFDTDILLK